MKCAHPACTGRHDPNHSSRSRKEVCPAAYERERARDRARYKPKPRPVGPPCCQEGQCPQHLQAKIYEYETARDPRVKHVDGLDGYSVRRRDATLWSPEDADQDRYLAELEVTRGLGELERDALIAESYECHE